MFYLQFIMKNKTGMVTDVSLDLVLYQNESLIRHITFQDIVNTVCSNSSKYKHKRSVTAICTGKIHNNYHFTHKGVFISLENP